MDSLLTRKLNQRVNVKDIDLTDALELLETVKHTDRFLNFLQGLVSVNAYYTKTFVKKLIDVLEARQDELMAQCEDFDLGGYYDLYISLISAHPKPTDEPEDILYALHVDDHRVVGSIKIRETPRLLNGQGSTGYRTWAACLYLANYLVWNFESFVNRTYNKKSLSIVELGAGTGLLSLTITKNFHHLVDALYITDGDVDVLERVRENFQLNGVDLFKSSVKPSIKVQKLWWGEDLVPENDLIIAADVTYDSSVFESLTETLRQSLYSNPNSIALISSTVRSEDTINWFETCLQNKLLKYSVVAGDEHPGANLDKSSYVCWSHGVPEIRIYKIWHCK